MVDYVVIGGQGGGYSGGTQIVGSAPAKVTAVLLRRGNKGEVKFTITLPTDSLFVNYAIYALDNTSLTDPGFPGGSPVVRDSATKTEDDTAKVGVRRHYWIVTQDVHGVPNSPVAANAFWAGSIIPTLSSTLVVS